MPTLSRRRSASSLKLGLTVQQLAPLAWKAAATFLLVLEARRRWNGRKRTGLEAGGEWSVAAASSSRSSPRRAVEVSGASSLMSLLAGGVGIEQVGRGRRHEIEALFTRARADERRKRTMLISWNWLCSRLRRIPQLTRAVLVRPAERAPADADCAVTSARACEHDGACRRRRWLGVNLDGSTLARSCSTGSAGTNVSRSCAEMDAAPPSADQKTEDAEMGLRGSCVAAGPWLEQRAARDLRGLRLGRRPRLWRTTLRRHAGADENDSAFTCLILRRAALRIARGGPCVRG